MGFRGHRLKQKNSNYQTPNEIPIGTDLALWGRFSGEIMIFSSVSWDEAGRLRIESAAPDGAIAGFEPWSQSLIFADMPAGQGGHVQIFNGIN